MGRKDTIMYYKVYLAKEIDPCYDRIYLLTDMEGYMTAEFLVSKSFNKAGAYLSITPNLNLPVVKISEDVLESDFTQVNFSKDDFVGNYIEFFFNNYLLRYFDGKGIYSKARDIRKRTSTSWKMAFLYAHIQSEEVLNEVLEEIREIYISRHFTDTEINTLLNGNLYEKKFIIRNIISSKAFNAMEVKTRGNKYITALVHELLRCTL